MNKLHDAIFNAINNNINTNNNKRLIVLSEYHDKNEEQKNYRHW